MQLQITLPTLQTNVFIFFDWPDLICLFHPSPDGRVGAGPLLCGDPVFGELLWQHLHAGSSPAPHAAVSCLVSLDHRSDCRHLAHLTRGAYTSLAFT